jgi:hypothetical protein
MHDKKGNRPLFRMNGLLPLPVDSKIELPGGRSARVVGIRLLQPVPENEEPAFLCLDVEVEP